MPQFTNAAAPPAATKPKLPQTFEAFDFSGLQDAAPLDETQDDPFRLSTRNEAFGEFDTSFDSHPVTPAKPANPSSNSQPQPQPQNDFNDFNWDISDFSAVPTSQQFTPITAPKSTLASNFDDVFSSFDRPTATVTPPALPPRQPSPDDEPNVKALTGLICF